MIRLLLSEMSRLTRDEFFQLSDLNLRDFMYSSNEAWDFALHMLYEIDTVYYYHKEGVAVLGLDSKLFPFVSTYINFYSYMFVFLGKVSLRHWNKSYLPYHCSPSPSISICQKICSSKCSYSIGMGSECFYYAMYVYIFLLSTLFLIFSDLEVFRTDLILPESCREIIRYSIRMQQIFYNNIETLVVCHFG